jgi:CBS domain-containing protein
MLVKDIMQTEVITVSPFATLREAMTKMKRHRVKSLVVERRDEHDAYGIITYTTILRTIVAEEGDIDLVNVYDVCNKPALIVPQVMDVKYVARMMVAQNLQRLVVLEHGNLVGLVTMNDIVGEVLALAEEGMDDKVSREQVNSSNVRDHLCCPASCRPGILRHARCPLGLRLPDRRRGGLRSRTRAGGLRRRGRLRHLLRRAHAAHRAQCDDDRGGESASSPTRCSRHDPAGVGSTGHIHLLMRQMDAMLRGGARWAVERATATPRPRAHRGARLHGRRGPSGLGAGQASASATRWARSAPATITSRSRKSPRCSTRRRRAAFGLREGEVVVSIHCGSRGLGHQIGTEFLREMVIAAAGTASTCPTASSPARRSTPKSASAISARCAPRSTARWPTGRS